MVDHWPDKKTIARLLPHRSMKAIEGFAGRCNLCREIHIWRADEDAKLRKMVREFTPRKDVAKAIGLTPLQVQNRMNYAKIRYGRKPPKLRGNVLVDSIRQRAFEMNIAISELDAECGGTRFQKVRKGGKVGTRHINKALRVLGGRLMIEWEPLEEPQREADRPATAPTPAVLH